MRKQSSMSGYMKKTPPSTSGPRVSQYATPTAGMKRPSEQTAGVKASAAIDTRQAKFRKLIGGGESKDLDSYREVQSRFNWLEDKLVKDAKGRRPQHQQYDPRTVAVPADAFQKLSDSQKQYWEIKQKYRDVILFFKIGTFYELYEDDAQIGHDILGWKMTITGVGHCRQEDGFAPPSPRKVVTQATQRRRTVDEQAREEKFYQDLAHPNTFAALVDHSASHLEDELSQGRLAEADNMEEPGQDSEASSQNRSRWGWAWSKTLGLVDVVKEHPVATTLVVTAITVGFMLSSRRRKFPFVST
ncbi:TPA: DNA mismatch repair protein msh7 [Trebouxia sp. C0006]